MSETILSQNENFPALIDYCERKTCELLLVTKSDINTLPVKLIRWAGSAIHVYVTVVYSCSKYIQNFEYVGTSPRNMKLVHVYTFVKPHVPAL